MRGVAFQVTEQGGPRSWRPPDGVFGPAIPRLEQWLKRPFHVPDFGCFLIDEGHVVGSGLAAANGGEIVVDDRIGINADLKLRIELAQGTQLKQGMVHGPRKTRRLDGTSVLLGGRGTRHFGHMLLDGLPRIAHAQLLGETIDRWIVPRTASPMLRQLVLMAGVPEASIETHFPARETLTCERLIVPSTGTYHGMPSQACKLIHGVITQRAKAVRAAPSRVFVSRALWRETRSDAIAGEDVLARIAEDRGFTVVHPQDLTIHDQVAMWKGVRLAVGPTGSGMHGIVWSAPGATTIDLCHPASYQRRYVHGVAAAFGHRFLFVTGVPIHSDGRSGGAAIRREALLAAISAATEIVAP